VSQDLRVAAWLGVSCFVLYALLGHGHFKSSDEISVYEVTAALWERGDLVVADGPHVFAGRGGRHYNHFAVGQSVLALPFYGLGRLLDAALPEAFGRALAGPRRPPRGRSGGRVEIWAVLLYPPLASGLLVAVFFLFQRSLGGSAESAAVAAALLATGTYVVNQSAYFLRHTTEALTILGALYGFERYRASGSLRSLVLASALAALTPLVRVPAAVAAPGLAGYLAWALRERARAGDGARRLLQAGLAVAAPLALALAVYAGVNRLKWGTWLYSPMLGQVAHFDTPLYVGLRGLLLSPGASVFLYSPLLLLCPWLLRRFWVTHRAECAAVLVVSASFLLVAASFWSWSGLWSAPGPRYVFVATPLLLLPLGSWLDAARERGARAPLRVAVVLGVLGALVQVAVTSSSWNTVVDLNDWRRWEPGMEFLFIPSESPILAGARALGQGYVDSWIWWIGLGWRSAPPRPGLAVLLALAGALLLVFCARQTLRAVRRHPERWGRMDAPGADPGPGAASA
jgi:hypothetical protein